MTEAEQREQRAPRPRRLLCVGLPLAICGALVLAGTASATPTATLKALALSIPGFPGTGNILGAGAEVEMQVSITGTEYGGFPSPMTGLNIFAPAGVKITTRGFATCAPSVLEADGPPGCPKQSSAGPPGVGFGVVTFGDEQVPETVSIQSFFAPVGGPTFYVKGNTPASFEVLEKSRWITASPPYGAELMVEVPLIETAPGGNDASVTGFKVRVGAAYKQGKKTVSYITQPKKCPKHGFPVEIELKFLSGQMLTVPDTVPCPRR